MSQFQTQHLAYWIWLCLTIILSAKIVLALLQLTVNIRFLLDKNTKRAQDSRTSQTAPPPVILYLFLPLLREQSILDELFVRFTRGVEQFDELRVVFITTEREIIDNRGQVEGTTIGGLKTLIEQYQGSKERIIHLHYPHYNHVVAEQLNYGLTHINKIAKESDAKAYIAIYNADSVVENSTFDLLLKTAKANVGVAQQSSLFLWNVPKLLSDRKYLLTGFGLYQSCWTLQHELTRYIFCRKHLPWLPTLIERHSLVHCVMHGLLIELGLLNKARGFPKINIGAEDLALGFILKVQGHHVYPLGILENAETPNQLKTLVNQLAGWFLGVLGYFVFWWFVPGEARKAHRLPLLTITAIGIFDALKWLFKGPLVLLYLALSIYVGFFILSFSLYVVYIYTALLAVLWLWYTKLPDQSFPKPPQAALIVSILVFITIPIVRSIPAFLGCWWGLKNALGQSFLKPKTER